ncbi:MAG: ROK family protein [Candidatus Ancillula sp.]|jgi:polyphosphate glucokinase|nr:ROK family protein [Candidatus Ancillula sp.]
MSDKNMGFGIDIGGSGIKGALVDLKTGEFASKRVRIPTPQPATPLAVVDTIGKIIDELNVPESVPVGVAFPGPIRDGVITYIANLDQSWLNTNLPSLLKEKLGREASVLNDADAAGYGEVIYGAARGEQGLVFATTLGTGIGTAIIYKGELIPRTELGHIEINGEDAEHRAAASARDREDLNWTEYAARLQVYYGTIEHLFSPDVIIIGGGVSEKFDKYAPLMNLKAKLVPAKLRNRAGIVGAAFFAEQEVKTKNSIGRKISQALASKSENAIVTD